MSSNKEYEIVLTNDFFRYGMMAEKGVKCVIRGYALVNDINDWLKKQETLKNVTLNELTENTNLILNARKSNTNLLDNLFDVTYEPSLELRTTNNDTFGSYKVRLNSGINPEGRYKAIALIGEKYTEDKNYVSSFHEPYLAAIVYFTGETTLEIKDPFAKTLSIQLAMTQATETDETVEVKIDESYSKITENVFVKDQTTTQFVSPGIFMVPSGENWVSAISSHSDYKTNGEFDVDNVLYLDKTMNLVPTSDKNNNFFNVAARFNVFDEHNDKFVKPQMLLSVGSDHEFCLNRSVGIEYDKNWFALNEKAPWGYSRIDIFGDSNAYDDKNFDKTFTYFRLVSDRGYLSGSSICEMFSHDNTITANEGTFFNSNNVCISAVNKINALNSDKISVKGTSGLFSFNSCSSYFNDVTGFISIGNKFASGYDCGQQGIMIGQNLSSYDRETSGAFLIGHEGLIANKSHSAIFFGNHNASDSVTASYWDPAAGNYRSSKLGIKGVVVAVGDGYFNKENFKDKFILNDYINISQADSCNADVGSYLKKMNLFSVEHAGPINVMNNNARIYDTVFEDFFAVRQWVKSNINLYDEDYVPKRCANLLNCCFSPNAIYFPKNHTHDKEWKLRLTDLENFLNDTYEKEVANPLNYNAIDKTLETFNNNNKTYELKLVPKYTFQLVITDMSSFTTLPNGDLYLVGEYDDTIIRRESAYNLKHEGKWENGKYIVYSGTTPGVCGKYGLSDLDHLKNSTGFKGVELVITGQSLAFSISDILKIIKLTYNKDIPNNGVNGNSKDTYTFYCINASNDPLIMHCGRLRKFNGRFQSLIKNVDLNVGEVQRLIYKDNGYYGEHGFLNINYIDP